MSGSRTRTSKGSIDAYINESFNLKPDSVRIVYEVNKLISMPSTENNFQEIIDKHFVITLTHSCID